jgi:hypothetical protein
MDFMGTVTGIVKLVPCRWKYKIPSELFNSIIYNIV